MLRIDPAIDNGNLDSLICIPSVSVEECIGGLEVFEEGIAVLFINRQLQFTT
jgi:hypothetical protein